MVSVLSLRFLHFHPGQGDHIAPEISRRFANVDPRPGAMALETVTASLSDSVTIAFLAPDAPDAMRPIVYDGGCRDSAEREEVDSC